MPALDSGVIAMWFGSIASIPAGFVLCDGNNGTPNLKNKFIVGAGDTYSVDDTGGNLVHQHSFTGDGHTHDIVAGSDIGAGANYSDRTGSTAVTGNTQNVNALPPYHSLCYIMKT